jgi:transposase-like protein
LDERVPAAGHLTEQYANNRVESDHGRLKGPGSGRYADSNAYGQPL